MKFVKCPDCGKEIPTSKACEPECHCEDCCDCWTRKK